MGTSKRYYPPSSPPWRPLRTAVSEYAESQDATALSKVVSEAVRVALGDAAPAGPRNAQVLAGAVASMGEFVQSLHDEEGERVRVWGQLGIEAGMSLAEIDRRLVDALLPGADTRPDVVARDALLTLLHELLDLPDAGGTLESLERKLTTDSIVAILRKYVAYFIYQLFLSDFSGILGNKYPPEIVVATCQEAKRYVLAKVDQMPENKMLECINWGSGDAHAAADSLVKEVWFVLEGESLP